MSETHFHDAFAAMLRGGARLPAAHFAGGVEPAGLPVYRNTVVRSAIEVLGDNYPAVRFLSGNANFAALAKRYWTAHPPRSGVMALYGAGFADFIEADAPPGMPDILPDTARIDRAWSEAHNAPDAHALTLGDLSGLDPEALSSRALRLHPSVRLPLSRRALYASWTAARFDARVVQAGPPSGETTLVWRPQMEVRHRPLTAGEAGLLHRIAGGAALGDAAERAGTPIEIFIRLLKDGVFARD